MQSKGPNPPANTRKNTGPPTFWRGGVRNALFRFGWTYLKGLIAIAVVVILTRQIVENSVRVASWFGDPLERPPGAWAILLGGAALLFIPWAIGLLTGVLIPRFRRDRGVQALMRWERNLTKELTPGESTGYRVALINFPNKDVRSIVVVASTFLDPESGRELAAVYHPHSPNPTRGGWLRVVPSEDLTMTDWSLPDLINYQLSFGSAVPPVPSDGGSDER